METQNTENMKTEEITQAIISMIKERENELWESFKSTRKILGEDSDACHRACARWSTVHDILGGVKVLISNISQDAE